MKPIGNIPSPYGVPVPVFFDRSRSANEDDCYFHDADGCMDIAGVHGPKNRARCKAELAEASKAGAVPFEIFLRHGGRKIERIPLTRPADPVYPRLPRDEGLKLPTENWATLALDHARWDTRADAMLAIIGDNLEQAKSWSTPPEVPALALSQMLTAALEHLVEPELDCLEAAAMYALTLHYDEWAEPAVEWLTPHRRTWFRDWISKRPPYKQFAALMRRVNPDLPRWIAGGQGGRAHV